MARYRRSYQTRTKGYARFVIRISPGLATMLSWKSSSKMRLRSDVEAA